MSGEQKDNQLVPPKSPDGSEAFSSGAADVPPSAGQLVTRLGVQDTPASDPGDSPPLPQFKIDLVNDGIVDQVSRRKLRLPAAIAAFIILAVFTVCLFGIVATVGGAFYQALKPENMATFAALEQKGRNADVASQSAEKSSAPPKLEKGANESSSSSAPASRNNDSGKGSDEHQPVKENTTNKVDTKIYSEIRDAMVPLVALVSILAVAIVVILGTLLKAAFAPHPNNSSDLQEKDETPVPLIEALKGLLESIKAVWK